MSRRMRKCARCLGCVVVIGVAAAAGPVSGQERTLRGEIDLVIGVMEGEPAYLFENIGALTRDAAGRIYVGDSGARNVRVYGADGGHLFQVTGPGEGPGEVRWRVCSLVIDPDGRLWVDAADSYKVFDVREEGAEYVRDVPAPDQTRQLLAEGNRLIQAAGGHELHQSDVCGAHRADLGRGQRLPG